MKRALAGALLASVMAGTAVIATAAPSSAGTSAPIAWKPSVQNVPDHSVKFAVGAKHTIWYTYYISRCGAATTVYKLQLEWWNGSAWKPVGSVSLLCNNTEVGDTRKAVGTALSDATHSYRWTLSTDGTSIVTLNGNIQYGTS